MPQLGRLTKGSAGSQEFGTYSFSGGLNVRQYRSPQLMGDDELQQALNGYVTAGGFSTRWGMASKISAIIAGANPVIGLARFFQQVKNGANVSTAITLAQIGSTLYNADTKASIGSIGAANPMSWVRCQDPNDPNFVSGNTDVIVICTGSGGPYVYDGTNLYTPAGWSSAAGARWCALVNGVVYFSGVATAPRKVFGTGDGIGKSFETLDATAQFSVSNPVTGLCALGTGAVASLCVGQNNGLTVIYGTGPGNYSQQDVPFFFDGPVSGRAMVYEAGIMYFLGDQAVYAFDGNQVYPISAKIEPWLLNDTAAGGYPLNGDRTKSFAFVSANRLEIGYINGNGSVPNMVLSYDLLLRAWTVQQPNPGIYCAAAMDAPTDPSPASIIVGSSSAADIYTWNVEPAIGAVNTDAGNAITSTLQTKPYKLGAPGTAKVLTRTYPEFALNGAITGTQTVTTDYGATTATNNFSDATNTQHALIAPTSRQDWNAQGDAFSFTVQTTGGSAAWTLTGLTAVFKQQGRA